MPTEVLCYALRRGHEHKVEKAMPKGDQSIKGDGVGVVGGRCRQTPRMNRSDDDGVEVRRQACMAKKKTTTRAMRIKNVRVGKEQKNRIIRVPDSGDYLNDSCE